MDYQKILKGIHQEIEPYATIGKQADYIPALAKINPDQFGKIGRASCRERVFGFV